MLCDVCGKRKAKIYYTEIVNGEKHEQHLCEECASEFSGISMKMGNSGNLTLGNVLSGILGSYAKGLAKKQEAEKACKQCGMTEQEFLKKGRFGCAACYEAFGEVIGNNLRVMQGADMHFGKRPVRAGFSKKASADELTAIPGELPVEEAAQEKAPELPRVEELKLQLGSAIAVEDYERAAMLRDQIRAIKAASQEQEKKVSSKKDK